MITGIVKRPEYDSSNTSNKPLTLTATLTCGDVTKIIEFPASVCMAGKSDAQSIEEDKVKLQDDFALMDTDKLKYNIQLPTIGLNGSTITWETSNANNLNKTGIVTRPDNGEADIVVILKASFTKGIITTVSESDKLTLPCTVLAWTDEDEVANDIQIVNWNTCRGNNSDVNESTNITNRVQVLNDLNLYSIVPPGDGITEDGYVVSNEGYNIKSRGCDVTWSVIYTTIESTEYIDSTGVLTRPTWTEGDKLFSLNCTVSKNSVTSTNQMILLYGTVVKLDISDLEVVDEAYNLLKIVPNGSIAVRTSTDIKLQGTFDNTIYPELITTVIKWQVSEELGSNSNWSSSVPNASVESIVDVVDDYTDTLVITRPAIGEGDKIIYLQAYINSADAIGPDQGKPKVFTITIQQEQEV